MSTLPAQLLADSPLVITGCGAISAAGIGVNALWEKACAGQPLAEWITSESTVPKDRLAGCRVHELPPVPAAGRKLDRSARLGLVAAEEAWHAAGLDVAPAAPERIGVIAGSSRGTVEKWGEAYALLSRGKAPPSLIASTTGAHLTGALSLHLGLQGPSFAVSATCASSAAAVVLGAQQLVTGAADVMLVGGAEAPLWPVVLQQFHQAGLLGTHVQAARTCRPFDATRNGTVLGEGAGFLVLETLASAQRRGRRIHGRLIGWALGAEAHGRAGMELSGERLARLIQQALGMAAMPPAQVGYLNLHGTGTSLNDSSEASAVRAVFGAQAPRPACSSTKPVTGHCMGAGSALEAIITLQALQHQTLPPNANCDHPDPACDLDLILDGAISSATTTALSLSAGFWGTQAALVFATGDTA